jgi:hypothetical protein
MVLSSSSALGGKVASAEALDAAVEACRVVLHELRRRVDATVSSFSAKSDLRQALKLAECALTNAGKAASHRAASAAAAVPTPLSSTEEHTASAAAAKGHGGRRPSADHFHGHHHGGTSHHSPSSHSMSGASARTSCAPPLPNKEECVTRPTVQSPTLLDGLRPESLLGDNAHAGAEGHVPSAFPSDASDTTKGDPTAYTAHKPHPSTAETCVPLCTPQQTAALFSAVLSAVFWKRRKLTEYALTGLEALLRAVAIPQDLSLTLVVDPALLNGDTTGSGSGGGHGAVGDRKGRRSNGGAAAHRRTGRIVVSVGTAVYYSLCECLTQSFSEPTVQVRALRLLNALIGGGGATGTASATGNAGRSDDVLFRPDGVMEDSFRSHASIRTIEACYAVAVEGTQETTRHQARLVLRTAVRHIVHAFVTMRVYDEAVADADDGGESHATFATDTILADYTVDVDHNEPFTPVRIVPAGKSAMSMSPDSRRIGGFSLISAASGLNATNDSNSSAGGGVRSAESAPVASRGDDCQGPRSCGSLALAGDAATAAPTPLASTASPTRHRDGDQSGNKDPTSKQADTSVVPDAPQADGGGGPALLFPTQSPNGNNDSFARGGHTGGISPQLSNLSFNPHLLFCNSIDDSLVTDALSTLNNTDGALPSALKDLLMLLRRMCRYAIRPCAGTLSDGNAGIRARDLSLWVLELTFEGLPVANCEQEHRCAVWMSLVMHACKFELLACLSKNLAVPAPFSFFERALHLLGMLLRKLHYHLARELHTLLGAFLLPLMVSKYAAFRQKHAVLAMIRQLFSVPHLCVSFFVNYDCNPAFDAGAEYGGMLELLVEHVVEMTFLDHVNEDGDAYPWLTSDQQQLLRSECVVIIHTLMQSFHRWIAEDPQEYAKALRRSARKTMLRQEQQQATGNTVDDTAELYLDNWEADDEVPFPEQASMTSAVTVTGAASADGVDESTTASTAGSNTGALHTRNLTIVLDATSGVAVPHWGKNRNIDYHWKHIHYLLHDKRIAQEAVQRINAGNWQDAKLFLETRSYMAAIPPSEAELSDPTTVGPGFSSYCLFARFLFDYPGISRDSLSKIFELVNKKDGASRLVLMEYLHCFNYVDVPIDVAMRDTTCKFMSWDRPMFESKVWETIQKCFGAEYARQNPNSITADDADTMAGVLLFLHSNLHNQVVKNNRIPVSQFVRDANDCLTFPMMEEDLQAMYSRVLSRKWELDIYGRTPQQAERERTLVRLSAKIHMGHAAQWRQQSSNANSNNSLANAGTNAQSNGTFSSGQTPPASLQRAPSPSSKDPVTTDTDPATLVDVLQGTETESMSCHSSFAASCSPVSASASAAQNPNASIDAASFQMWMSNDVALLDNTIPSYTDNKDTLKLKDQQHHAFLEASAVYLNKLESVHRLYCIEGEAYRPQPYIVPYYAEHVRQMLLMTYPHVMSCVYMGFRILEEAPIARKLLDTLQVTYDIAAAFVLNLRDLRPVMEEALQRYLADERAYKLLPPSRATLVPLMLNVI